MFKRVTQETEFPKMEEETLRFWEKEDVFAKSLAARKGAEEFIFYDGPPFATGLPHYGHLLAGTIKDVIPRYQTMLGKYCRRTFGWDCHGLPVEYEMEKQLKLSGKREIERYGVDKFNESCRGIVLRYTSEWESIVKRMGRWVDFRNGYRTMDLNYMESIWWVFKQLWDKGLIYEGYKILPYCARCSTPLSNFEANQGYKEVTDNCVTVRFKVLDQENTYILAWTTTPWTLPSNTALCVGPDIDYVRVRSTNPYTGSEAVYVVAKELVGAWFNPKGKVPFEVLDGVYKGRELVGIRYEQLIPWFKPDGDAFRVIPGDYVTTEDGTGIVHIAPTATRSG